MNIKLRSIMPRSVQSMYGGQDDDVIIGYDVDYLIYNNSLSFIASLYIPASEIKNISDIPYIVQKTITDIVNGK